MKLSELEAVIEAILFIAGEAVPLSVLARAVDMDQATTKAMVRALADRYEEEKRGIRITEVDKAYQMCTAPACFSYIRDLYQPQKKQGLSQTLLETLAIIAYKQPITKAQIEEIRGVSAEHAVNRLVERGLVCEAGRLDIPGKPILFSTTKEFLRYFGLPSTKELPPLDEQVTLTEEELPEPMRTDPAK